MNPHAATPVQGYARKLFYRIGEVADIVGVKPYVLRYWETEFPELNPEKDGSDQRRYRPRDVHTALAIRKLLYEDRFTIKGARGRLRDEIRGSDPRDRAAANSDAAEPPSPPESDADRRPETDSAGRAPAIPPAEMRRELSRLREEVLELVAFLNP